MKQSFTLLLLILVFIKNSAQSQSTIQWQKSLGGSGEEMAKCIRPTTDGGYIIAGHTHSVNGDITSNHGDDDYWIVKINSTGTIEWEKSFGGSYSDDAVSIQQTPDGGYIVLGTSLSPDGDVTNHHGGNNLRNDYWIVKLSSTGDLKWQKSLGGSGDDFAESMQPTADGGYIVAGWTNSTDGDVTGNHGDYDGWIVKLNRTGSIEWEKSIGGSGTDRAWCVQQTIDGGYIVAGSSSSNDGDVTNNHGGEDFWIVKLNGKGGIQRQKCFGGSRDDLAFSIQQTADSGYIVAGRSASSDGDVSGNNANEDYWIVKLDAGLKIEWQNNFGGGANDDPYSVQQTSDGGYIVAGYTESDNDDVTGYHCISDGWVLKLSNMGNLQWQKTLGGSGADYSQWVQQTSDEGYIIAGFSYSIDGDVADNHGDYDYWIVKLSPDNILPLQLTAFDAKQYNNTVACSWNTIQKQNTSAFIIEYSTNAAAFTKIGTVSATGNSNNTGSYTFTHKNPQNGINYYRLKMVDADGKFTYSNVVSATVTIGISHSKHIQILPR